MEGKKWEGEGEREGRQEGRRDEDLINQKCYLQAKTITNAYTCTRTSISFSCHFRVAIFFAKSASSPCTIYRFRAVDVLYCTRLSTQVLWTVTHTCTYSMLILGRKEGQ